MTANSVVLKELPIAADAEAPEGLCPGIFFGKGKHSAFDLDPEMFELARTLMTLSGDKSPHANVSAEQVHIEHAEPPLDVLLNYAMGLAMVKYGFKGSFCYSLRGLKILGEGARITIDTPADKRISRLLVDLPLFKMGGLIHATCEGRTRTFDFSHLHRNSTALAFLHWFRGTTVTIEPISKGLRAFLLYDVIPEPTSLPLKIVPRSNRMHNLEMHVQSLVQMEGFRRLQPKTCFLPLVRILIHICKSSEVATPVPFLDLYYQVVKSHRMRMQQATASHADEAVLAEIGTETTELISSFGGGPAMRGLLGESCFAELSRHIRSMRYYRKSH